MEEQPVVMDAQRLRNPTPAVSDPRATSASVRAGPWAIPVPRRRETRRTVAAWGAHALLT